MFDLSSAHGFISYPKLGSNNVLAEGVHMGQKAERGLQNQKKNNLVSCPSESEGQATQVGIHPLGAGADGEASATAGRSVG